MTDFATAGFITSYILFGFKNYALLNRLRRQNFFKEKREKKRLKSRKKREKESQFFSARMSECKIFGNKKFAKTNKVRKKK